MAADGMLFLQGNLALWLGLTGLALTLVIRRLSRDQTLRADLVGPAVLFAVYGVLRVGGEEVAKVVPDDWEPYVRVTWMLAFAYGAVRLLVALVLGVRRRLVAGPSAKIQRDVADFVLYVVCTIPILKTQLKIDVTTLLGTSAVLSLVLGFALQDTLSNLFSGISLQLERPFGVGDFIRVGEHEGRVVQIAWRSTRLQTVRHELVNFPNSEVAKEHVVVYSAAKEVGLDVEVGVAYAAPPNVVKSEVLAALADCPTVLKSPAPSVRVVGFGENAVNYQIRVCVLDMATAAQTRDEILSRLWYRFGRAGLEIPYPQRVVQMRNEVRAALPEDTQRLLERLEWFAPFPPEELASIAAAAKTRHFGAGERIVAEGDDGQTFYVVVSGTVSVQLGDERKEVARLGAGEAFGEMSLLTGEKRSATVVAVHDALLLEVDREAFAKHFTEKPERAAQLAELLERRRAQLTTIAADTTSPEAGSRSRVIDRLREIFRLRT